MGNVIDAASAVRDAILAAWKRVVRALASLKKSIAPGQVTNTLLNHAFGKQREPKKETSERLKQFHSAQRAALIALWRDADPLHKSDDSHIEQFAEGNRFAAWKAAIDALEQRGEALKECEIDSVWNNLFEDGKRFRHKIFNERQVRRDAFLRLYNLNTGPASFAPSRSHEHYGKYTSSHERDVVPGLNVQQDVFLDGPTGLRQFGGDRPLDLFAKSISDSDGVEGVYCLAGTRGSGKSTVLNRIEWFCRTWFDNNKTPLFLRIDLGCAFNSKQFPIDLMAEIARVGRASSLQSPHCSAPGSTLLYLCIGTLGRWCMANLFWLLMLGMLAYAIYGIGGVAIGAKEPLAIGKDVLASIAVTASILCWTGLAYRFRRKSIEHGLGPRVLLYTLLGTVTMAVPLFVLPSAMGLFVATRTALAIAALNVVLVFLAASLPRWWWTYEHCDSMLGSLRNASSKSTPDVPSNLSAIAAVVRFLLPQPADLPSIVQQDTAFQHQQMKDFVRHCCSFFGRMVLLIDDVDVLPSTHFHELFRVLRPLSKVPCACVVVCVPEYFYYAVRAGSLGDVHSTVRDVYLIGSRSSKTDAAAIEEVMEGLLNSRCRLPIESASRCLPVRYASEQVLADFDGASSDQISIVCQSRRELLRAIDRAVRPKAPTDPHHAPTRVAELLAEKQLAYGQQERSLIPQLQDS